jgi:4a-hydroxytetrahydrobiopterin dehydratase
MGHLHLLGGFFMSTSTLEDLSTRHCTACTGGVERLLPEQVRERIGALHGWRITHDGLCICKEWQLNNFMEGIDFFNRVAKLAEEEGHHPDLHLENYRHVRIELWTHEIGGLSENDFILANKIDSLPVELKK